LDKLPSSVGKNSPAHGMKNESNTSSIVLFINPPSGVVFFYLLAASTALIGQGLAWAWGTIAMKAALATRPQAELQAKYAELQKMATQNTTNADQASGQSTFTQLQIFNGFMLDTRVSATYLCMIGLFVYFLVSCEPHLPSSELDGSDNTMSKRRISD
jgi:hypothetical protein